MLRIRDPVLFWPLNPGSGIGKNPDLGFVMKILDLVVDNNFLGWKYQIYESGSGILSTLNPGYGMEKVGPGIRDKHPGSANLCIPLIFLKALISRANQNKYALSKFFPRFFHCLLALGNMIRVVHPGSGFFTDPENRGQKGTGSRIRLRNTGGNTVNLRKQTWLKKLSWTVMFTEAALRGAMNPFKEAREEIFANFW